MARAARSSRLETPEARRRLKKQNEPYWLPIDTALAVGYRKGTKGGTWHLRRRSASKYLREVIGIANDYRDANGKDVLDFFGAQRKARERVLEIERHGGKSDRA